MELSQVLQLFYKFLLALTLGALIGIEREKSQQKHKGTDFAGVRTFMLISFFGAVTAYLSALYYSWLVAVVFFSFVLVVLAGYILSSYFNKQIGMTTELSAILAFIIGILSFSSDQEVPIFLAVLTTLILSFKTHLHQFVYQLKNVELIDTMKFLLIAFVILPLLQTLPKIGIIDLYEIWLMIVFVSGLSYVGYILIKLFGTNRGNVITGFLGGILSSTAVVSSLSAQSKEHNVNVKQLAIAAGIASSTMFLRLLIVVSVLNINLISKLAFPLILMAITGYITVSLTWRKSIHQDTKIKFSSPLLLKPALKFGIFYGFIQVLSHALNNWLGPKGLIVAGLVSGLADADAITLFVARHIGTDIIDIRIGILAIILAALVNTLVKIVIARVFGKKEFMVELAKILVPVVAVGVALILVVR